ncbi:Rubredoxin-like domain-containing protein, partial [Dysosmobacter welbionis]
AQVAGEEFSQFIVRVLLAALQDLHCRQDKARRAEAALDGRLVHKGLLDVAELAVRAQQPFQGADVLALRPHGQINAGVVCLPVDQDVAGAALPHLAA